MTRAFPQRVDPFSFIQKEKMILSRITTASGRFQHALQFFNPPEYEWHRDLVSAAGSALFEMICGIDLLESHFSSHDIPIPLMKEQLPAVAGIEWSATTFEEPRRPA